MSNTIEKQAVQNALAAAESSCNEEFMRKYAKDILEGPDENLSGQDIDDPEMQSAVESIQTDFKNGLGYAIQYIREQLNLPVDLDVPGGAK